MDLLIATANAGKVREFREMLDDPRAPDRFQWSDLSASASPPTIEETGQTFRANACLKASGYASHFNRWALADDSGLEVDALDNSPGVYSARWAQMHDPGNKLQRVQSSRDADNNRLLLDQIRDVSDDRRTARFVCVLALSDPLGRIILTARDTVEGRILHTPRGTNGFGYDPLFFLEDLCKTTAELSPQEKHAVSHRGKALRAMKELMRRAGMIGDRSG